MTEVEVTGTLTIKDDGTQVEALHAVTDSPEEGSKNGDWEDVCLWADAINWKRKARKGGKE